MAIKVTTGQVTLSKTTRPYAGTVMISTQRATNQPASSTQRQFTDAESPETAGLIGLEQYRSEVSALLEAIDDAICDQFKEIEGQHQRRRRYRRQDENMV